MRLNALTGLSIGALALCCVTQAVASATLERRFQYSSDRFTMRQEGSSTVVEMEGATREFTLGRPDVPWLGELVEVPGDQRVTGIEVVSIETAVLAPRAALPSAILPKPGLGPVDRTSPDPTYFKHAGLQPEQPVRLGMQGWQRGANVAALEICPVRWDAVSGRLERITSITVRLKLDGAIERAIPRQRVVPEWEDAPVRSGPVRMSSIESTPGRAQPFKATQIPSVLGSPVAYVIITNDAMASEFQRLADWKTQSGVPAVVRTLSFIHQQYPAAADDAERIRLFIRDAYSRWGTKWVLLGGDTEVIPTRMVFTTYFGGEEIASDLYYSCIDGNWNADGDDLFGEGYHGVADPGDACDLMPDVWVGRAPATTVATAASFVDKTLTYSKTSPGNYENTALFFAEVLFPQPYNEGDFINLDGARLAEDVLPHVRMKPIHYARLYQTWNDPQWEPGALPETRQAVLDSLNVGYNVSCHIGHGYTNVMSVADANLENSNVMGLTNGNRLTNLYATNCTSNAIDFPCIGEAFILAPNGGAVTNVGSSRFDFPSTGQYYQQEWFKLVFRNDVTAAGEAQGKQKLPFISSSNNDGINRWTQMALLLLGDPELRIYTGLPATLSVTHAASIPLSDTAVTVHVTVGGTPLAGARVSAYKAGDDYRVGTTNASGDLVLPFRPDGIGNFLLTVTSFNARPYLATVAISPTGSPVLGDLAPTLDDDNASGTHGNSNATIDAGETVDIRIPVRNNGGATATLVNGVLSTTDPLVTIVNPNVAYGTIGPGASSNPATGFRITVPYTLPDQRELAFKLTLTDNAGRVNTENIQLTALAPEFLHLSHAVTGGNGNSRPDSGETVQYAVRLRNLGTGGTSLVTGKLRAKTGVVTVTDSTATWGTFTAGQEKIADAFAFALGSSSATLELHVFNEYGEIYVQTIDVGYPEPPTDLSAFGYTSTVDVRWGKSAASDLRGYNIYHSLSLAGPYTKVTPVPTDRTSYYRDSGLSPLTVYYFEVTAVDSSGNESDVSAVISAGTTPGYHAIFPIPMGVNTTAHVAIDHVYDPYPVDIASSAQVIFMWHPDGNTPVDADGAGATHGDLTTLGSRYEAGPSIADLDGDGEKEIIGPTWNPDVYGTANPHLYVFDKAGNLKPGFPAVATDPVWSCVAVGDLNNDGQKEMVFGSNGSNIYVYRANGTEWMDGDNNPATVGVFKRLAGAGYHYGTPAIADVDGNGIRDIVYGTNDKKLHVWRPDGTELTGFPVNLNGYVSDSPAVGYLDGPNDSQLDIVISTGDYGHGSPYDSLFAIRANGQRRPGWPVAVIGSYTSRTPSPALGDMNRDGFVDVVFTGTDGYLRVLNRNGQPIAPCDSFQYSPYLAASESSPVIADINGDGWNDILIGADTRNLLGLSGATGTLLPGFPIALPSEPKGSPAVCDCDNDGMTEIVTTTLDGSTYIWDYDQPFSPGGAPPWPQYHHDAARTGFLGSPLVVDAPQQVVMPVRVELAPAQPNPAGRNSRIAYSVPSDRAGQAFELVVYDLNGREVRTLEHGIARAGRFSSNWDLRNRTGGKVDAGVYFVRLTIGDRRASQKLIVLK
jgi:hypothetical protein